MIAKARHKDILKSWKGQKQATDPYAGKNKNFCMLHQFSDVVDAGFVDGEMVVMERKGGVVRERDVYGGG